MWVSKFRYQYSNFLSWFDFVGGPLEPGKLWSPRESRNCSNGKCHDLEVPEGSECSKRRLAVASENDGQDHDCW